MRVSEQGALPADRVLPADPTWTRARMATAADATPYNGERTANAISRFAMDALEKAGWEQEVDELVSQKQFSEGCDSANQICVRAFLPDIRDTMKSGRLDLINLIKGVATRARGASYTFFWLSAGQHKNLEQLLDLRAGFPTVAVLNVQKKIYSVFSGAFSERKVAAFVDAKGSVRGARKRKVESWPKLATVAPWDGEDPPAIEEEFSLDEIMDL